MDAINPSYIMNTKNTIASMSPGFHSITHPIAILDTGDNYILAFKSPYIYNDALKLYAAMDLEVTEITTNALVSWPNMQFIFDTFGRVFSNGLFSEIDLSRNVKMEQSSSATSSATSLSDRLKSDVEVAASFAKSRNYWENMQYPPRDSIQPQMHNDTVNGVDTTRNPLRPASLSDADCPLTDSSAYIPTILNVQCDRENAFAYIFYNNIIVIYESNLLFLTKSFFKKTVWSAGSN